MPSPIAVALILNFILLSSAAAAATFSLDLHHRFSAPVQRLLQSQAPEPGALNYYSTLVRHDVAIHNRELSAVAFADGNDTHAISALGFLHYAAVTVGTPGVTFLVALDTGSDLFWLPCECRSCAPTASIGNGYEFEFSIYSPNISTTSQAVPCNSSLCEVQSKCSRGSNLCPYEVAYVSSDTSSSGYLVEDVLSLTTEDTHAELLQTQILFGCGQVQTGSFLDAAAPNGLFGLGMEKISVPSILASAGIISDSFSMCFGRDGVGRISFGDQGSSDQEETPFNLKQSYSTYNISITGMSVGNSPIGADFSALVDSGTSFTYLADPAYTHLTQSFNAMVKDKRLPSDSTIPFEYCYLKSSNDEMLQIPAISLTTKGGHEFPVTDPAVVTTTRQQDIYCLAIVKSNNLNIIGQNFMTGLRIVFDRERMVLGWKKFNCYDIDESNPLPVNLRNSSTAPTGPKSYTPEATEGASSGTQAVLPPPNISHSTQLFLSSFTLIFMLLLAIILW